ncbi:hypothetical protein CIK99_08480 [Prevotella sp. P5-92]|nr:hypothetical protein CIK99_08480 [Prevotella sp. P5-92]
MSIFAPNLQFESKILMNKGRYIFSQLCDFLPTDHFKWLVKKYDGNKYGSWGQVPWFVST